MNDWERRRTRIARLLTMLIVGAIAVVAWEAASSLPREQIRDFQRLTGGVGLGGAADAADCCLSFDPRMSAACDWDAGPLIGGGWFCTRHSLSVFPWAETSAHDLQNEE